MWHVPDYTNVFFLHMCVHIVIRRYVYLSIKRGLNSEYFFEKNVVHKEDGGGEILYTGSCFSPAQVHQL